MAISGKVGAIYAQTTDAAIAMTNEVTTALSGAGITAYTQYKITNAVRRYMDKNTAVVVKKNGSVVPSGYSVDYIGGTVIFDVALLNTDTVTITGAYFNVSQVASFFNWSIDLSGDTTEVTTFASMGWKEFAHISNSFTASADSYFDNDNFLARLGTEMIVVFYVDSGTSKKRYEGYAIVSSDSVELANDAMAQQSLEFTGVGSITYREG